MSDPPWGLTRGRFLWEELTDLRGRVVVAGLVLADLLGRPRRRRVGARLRRRVVGAAVGLAHLGRAHPYLARAPGHCNRGRQGHHENEASAIDHLRTSRAARACCVEILGTEWWPCPGTCAMGLWS